MASHSSKPVGRHSHWCPIIKDLTKDVLADWVLKSLSVLHVTLWLLTHMLHRQEFSSTVCQAVTGATGVSTTKFTSNVGKNGQVSIKAGDCSVVIGHQCDEFLWTWSVEHFVAQWQYYPGSESGVKLNPLYTLTELRGLHPFRPNC